MCYAVKFSENSFTILAHESRRTGDAVICDRKDKGLR